MRPDKYHIDFYTTASDKPRPRYLMQIISNGRAHYRVLSNLQYYVHKPGNFPIVELGIWVGTVAPVAGFFDHYWSPVAILDRFRKKGEVAYARVDGMVAWEGKPYKLVEFQVKGDQTNFMPVFGFLRTMTEQDYIGTDGIIHRTVRKSDSIIQDVQLRNIILNRPIPFDAFLLPEGAKLGPVKNTVKR